MKTIALDLRFRVPSGASIAMQQLFRRLLGQAPPGVRFVSIRYEDQELVTELEDLESLVVPKMSALMELAWNEFRLPGLMRKAGVDLYHGLKQCAPYRTACKTVHTVDAVKRGSGDALPLPLSHRLYFGAHVCHVYKRSEHLMPVSDHVGAFLRADLKIDPERMTVVHNGVDDPFLEAGRNRDGSTGNPLNLAAPMILSVGTLIPLKNQLATVKALATIADRVPHHLVLLGREDAEYGKQVREAAEAGGIADRVHFVGFVDAAGLMGFLTAAELMVHVSRTEGFCMATGEAMACGLPLILTDRGGLKEQCLEAAVYLDDPDDHDGLANHLLRVLTDPDMRDTMRQRGLDRAGELSWDEAAKKTLAVYEHVLD